MEETDNKALVYTDGSSSGNPGPGGYGTVILLPQGKIEELGGYEEHTTNNRMELRAVLETLKFFSKKEEKIDEMVISTDSTYVLGGATGWVYGWAKNGWKTKEGNDVSNQDIWQELMGLTLKLSSQNKKVSYEKVKGHSGDFLNERANEIAQTYSKGTPPILFRGQMEQFEELFGYLKNLPASKQKKENKGKAYSYVARVNGETRIFSDWDSCKDFVQGKAGALFKKVFSEAEEKELVETWQNK